MKFHIAEICIQITSLNKRKDNTFCKAVVAHLVACVSKKKNDDFVLFLNSPDELLAKVFKLEEKKKYC